MGLPRLNIFIFILGSYCIDCCVKNCAPPAQSNATRVVCVTGPGLFNFTLYILRIFFFDRCHYHFRFWNEVALTALIFFCPTPNHHQPPPIPRFSVKITSKPSREFAEEPHAKCTLRCYIFI
jgi:hypothetical protein